MKKIVIILVLFCVLYTQAQNRLDDIKRIAIHAYVPESESLTYESAKLLTSKLAQMVTKNGIADDENGVRFVLTAKTNIISQDIVVGPPQHISQKLEVTLILGDIVENKVYSQLTIPAVGVGQSYEKALTVALKSINSNDPAVSTFLKEGKIKVIDYYQTHCEELIAEAQKLASLQNYENAIMLLTSIPDVCTTCFEKAIKTVEPIYVDMIETRGSELLNQAKITWAKNPTKEGAKEASRLLSQINFAASCMTHAADLIKEITMKMNEIDRREWEHEMQVYQDSIEREKREWQQHIKEYEDGVQTQRMFLQAARDVAISYAQNQPKEITRIINYNRILLW